LNNSTNKKFFCNKNDYLNSRNLTKINKTFNNSREFIDNSTYLKNKYNYEKNLNKTANNYFWKSDLY
jgi:hypothetical protein